MILTEYDEQEEREYQRAEGRAEGDSLRLISQIQKKRAKAKPLSTIAEELEESEEVLRPLYELVTEHRDNTSEELLELWQKEKK